MNFDHVAYGIAHALPQYQSPGKEHYQPGPMTNAKCPEIKKGMLSHNVFHSGISILEIFKPHCKLELVNEQSLKIHLALASVRTAGVFH